MQSIFFTYKAIAFGRSLWRTGWNTQATCNARLQENRQIMK